MVSYFKTQWFRLLVGCICLGLAIFFLFQPAVDESTLEGLSVSMHAGWNAFTWFFSSMLWFVMSFTSYNSECLKKMDERLRAFEEKDNENNMGTTSENV